LGFGLGLGVKPESRDPADSRMGALEEKGNDTSSQQQQGI